MKWLSLLLCFSALAAEPPKQLERELLELRREVHQLGLTLVAMEIARIETQLASLNTKLLLCEKEERELAEHVSASPDETATTSELIAVDLPRLKEARHQLQLQAAELSAQMATQQKRKQLLESLLAKTEIALQAWDTSPQRPKP